MRDEIEKTVNVVSPLKKICMTIGELPTSYLESMTYYEMLLWFTNYLRDVIIPTVNNNAEAVVELQELFVKLQNYVNDYFDNLDVQDEINNKIDEMVESGEFEEILSRLVPSGIPHYYDTVQDLKEGDLEVGETAYTFGFYTKYDGGGALYKITDNTTFDDMLTHEMTNGNCAELFNQKEFNILQIGAKRNDDTFNNNLVLAKVLKRGLSNLTVYIPDGIYYTTPVDYDGDNIETRGINLIGVGKPTIKLLHPNVTFTTLGTYTGDYTITDNVGVIDFSTSCSVATITLEDGRAYYYLKVSDTSVIPESLTKGLVLEGSSSHTKAVISNIDTNNPDGSGTARIYLFETYNKNKKTLNFKTTNLGVLDETLKIKDSIYLDYLYLSFDDNIVPEYINNFTVNTQIEQINGKKARINRVNEIFETIIYTRLDCFEKGDIFENDTIYLDDNVEFSVKTPVGSSSGIFSFNKFINVKFENIIFDGNNLYVSNYQEDGNNFNFIISGGCKNITVKNCEFKNAIMGGIQVGGISNPNSPASHDYPENLLIDNCYFQNNGRGDIEVINGKNIMISNCNGDGTIDIETNGIEMLDNINIVNCNFLSCTPYSPANIDGSTMINIANSKFFNLVAQNKVVVNLSNVFIHQLQPQIATIKGSNCYVNLLNGLHGNEQMFFTNTTLLSLFQNNPGGYNGLSKMRLDNSIVDLSLTGGNRIYNYKLCEMNNCTIISSTVKKPINDVDSCYHFNNCIMKNVNIDGGSQNVSSIEKSIFKDCRFLSADGTNGNAIRGTLNTVIDNCYIEASIVPTYATLEVYNSVISRTTKPIFQCYKGGFVNGLKTHDGSGINYKWISTPASGSKVKFIDVEYSDQYNSETFGIDVGITAVNTSSVSDECRGYYVGNSDKALFKLYYNSSTLSKKEISFS